MKKSKSGKCVPAGKGSDNKNTTSKLSEKITSMPVSPTPGVLAFEEWYSDSNYKLCLARVRRQNLLDPENLFRDLILEAIEKFNPSEGEFGNFLSWFIEPRCISQRKKESRVEAHSLEELDYLSTSSASEAGLEEIREVLEIALHRIPAADRELLYLRYEEGLKLREISGFGLSLGGLKSKSARARQKLKSIILELMPDIRERLSRGPRMNGPL